MDPRRNQRTGISRRSAIAGACAFLTLPACTTRLRRPVSWDVRSIESILDGKVGVSAVNLANGRRLGYREHERFALCSTFKWALAAQVLLAIDRGKAALDEQVAYSREDIVPYSPVTGPAVANGILTLGELCAAAVTLSDNTAANLLLRKVGGPSAFTAFLRRSGDRTTRLDRIETELNENAFNDPRDTTTPLAMTGLMARLLFGGHLSVASRDLLRSWMQSSTTGMKRLRAGLPPSWVLGDKTGTSVNGASNDVAFALPAPGSRPLLIACYVNAPTATDNARNAAHEIIARQVASLLGT